MLEVPSIGEILIYDNDPDNAPNDPIFKHPKVNCVSFGKNIYVNPAWNMGVRFLNTGVPMAI